MIPTVTESASRTVKRQAAYEAELDSRLIECVFSAGTPAQLKELVERTVFSDVKYAQLPKYRQIALEAYFRGVMDALARVSGVHAPPISMARVRTSPPPRPKKARKPRTTTPLHPTQPTAIKTPVPSWLFQHMPPTAIIPPLTPLSEVVNG